VGAGGVGAGGVGPGGLLSSHSAHQQIFPPFPHESFALSLKHTPSNPATLPSAQIVSGRGSFLAQTCLNTI
jgi:hypothetical protein